MGFQMGLRDPRMKKKKEATVAVGGYGRKKKKIKEEIQERAYGV